MPLRTLTVVVLVSGALAASGEDRSVFTAGIDAVHLTVSVRDKQGHLVSDLGPGDFEVLEDGRPQKLELFYRADSEANTKDNLSLDVGLMMDTSESMGDEMSLSRQAAVHFLDSIPRAHDVLTVFFDQDIQISRYDSENQQGLFGRIHELKATGTTALYDAITAYLARAEGGSGRKILVLLTDGEDSSSDVTAGELFDMVRGSTVTVYPIALTHGMATGSERAVMSRSFLHRLAELSGGEVFTPTGPRDLSGIYQKILDEMGAQYVLGFSSDSAQTDGRFRKIKIEVKRKGLKVRHRAGYFAPKVVSSR